MSAAQLELGRDCYERRAWSEAFELLSMADRTAPLGAGDLELRAESAYLTGREFEFTRLMERAHQAHAHHGDPARAARAGFWLGLTLLLKGEAAQSNGWLARAQRLIKGFSSSAMSCTYARNGLRRSRRFVQRSHRRPRNVSAAADGARVRMSRCRRAQLHRRPRKRLRHCRRVRTVDPDRRP